MKRRSLFAAAFAVALAPFAHAQMAAPAPTAAAPTAAVSPIPMNKRIVLLVDEIRQVRNLPAIVAERLGYLKGNGFEVTMMNIRDEVPHAQMLMDGQIDAIMAYYHHNLVNHSDGRDTQAIVTLGVTPGAKVLVANHAKDKYKTPADLKGARIIVGGPNSSKTAVGNALLLAGGHTVNDYIRLPTEGKEKNAAALREGRADLFVAPVPEGDYYEKEGVASVFVDLRSVEGTKKQFGTLFPTSTVYMASERIKAHPEIAQHLADAFVRALHYMNTHSAEQIAALLPEDFFKKDREGFMTALKQELPMFANDGRMPADGAQYEHRVISALNAKVKPVVLEGTYTNRFVDAALKRLGQ